MLLFGCKHSDAFCGRTVNSRSIVPGRRRNRVLAQEEHWRPPRLTTGHPLASALRYFFDLQAQSIRRDIAPMLRKAEGTVLDVGCGGQPFRPLLGNKVRYVAIDHASAGARFGYHDPSVRYFHGNRWPVEDRTVDLVLCTEVLEHILEPCRALEEAYRCLRPGGRLLATVPFAARWHFVPHDYWRYTPSSLGHLLGQVGFIDVEVYARGNPITVACAKINALIFPLLAPQNAGCLVGMGCRALGLLTFPLFLLLTLLGNWSLRRDWGDDCLGYTVTACRPAEGAGE